MLTLIFFFVSSTSKKFNFKDVAIKQIFDVQNISEEENRLRFEKEIAIMWGISSHPNIITLVGYCENPLCIITKVLFFFFLLLFFQRNERKKKK